MPARWKWILRPKWLVVLTITGCFLGWLFWPVKVYDTAGRTRGFSITLAGSNEATPRSVSVTPRYATPWTVGNRLGDTAEKWGPSRTESAKVGDRAFWLIFPSGNVELAWVRGNIDFLLRVVGPFEGFDPRTPGWKAACERAARQIDAEFLAGRAGAKQVRVRWIPRVVLWGLVKRREWRWKNGVRTHGWW